MARTAFGVALALLAASLSLHGQKTRPQVITLSDVTGNQLLKNCSEGADSNQPFCVGFVEGVRDGATVAMVKRSQKAAFIIPADVGSDQLTDVVKKYLSDHPESRHKAAAELTIAALQNAFPAD